MEDQTPHPNQTLVERAAGRVVLLDADDRVLLVEGRDVGRPDAGTWWFTPGGGTDPGEDTAGAARRELFEETGIHVPDVGACLATRHASFPFEDMWFEQDEDYFVVRVPGHAPRVEQQHVTEWEARNLLGMHWWDRRALDETVETIFPAWLPDLLATLLDAAAVPHDTPDEATFHDVAIAEAGARLRRGRSARGERQPVERRR